MNFGNIKYVFIRRKDFNFLSLNEAKIDSFDKKNATTVFRCTVCKGIEKFNKVILFQIYRNKSGVYYDEIILKCILFKKEHL